MAGDSRRRQHGVNAPVAPSCRLARPRTLDERYRQVPCLLTLYKKKLIEPGWAWELSRLEVDYIKAELRQCHRLRVCWGFRSRAKRFPEAHIRAVARNGRKTALRCHF